MRSLAPLLLTINFSFTVSCGNSNSFGSGGGTEKSTPIVSNKVVKSETLKKEIPDETTDASVSKRSRSRSKPKSLSDVNKLCENKTVKTMTQEVVFPPATQACSWGLNDNMPFPTDNLVFTARNEQEVNLDFPAKGVLCDMEFGFDAQTMVYDDEIIMTLNDLVLASSQNYSAQLQKSGKYLKYDWESIKGIPYQINDRALYCVGSDEGKGQCFIPPTQQQGRMELLLDGEVVRQLGLSSGISGFGEDASKSKTSNSKTAFKLVTLGDNDQQIDCKHSGFKFAVTYHYVDN